MPSFKEVILARPSFYSTFQDLVGARRARQRFISEYISPRLKPDAHVLDVGCGPATLRSLLPKSVKYTGIDSNPAYLQAARKLLQPTDSLILADLGDSQKLPSVRPDLVIAAGVLHHLPDPLVSSLLTYVSQSLDTGGYFISFDPSFFPGQSRLARILVSLDRGQHVRTEHSLAAILRERFSSVETRIVDNFLRIPYGHCFAICHNRPTSRAA